MAFTLSKARASVGPERFEVVMLAGDREVVFGVHRTLDAAERQQHHLYAERGQRMGIPLDADFEVR